MPSSPFNTSTPFAEVLERRLSRRTALRGGAALMGGALVPTSLSARSHRSTLRFPELAHRVGKDMRVARGYNADVLIRWGDSLFADSPEFNPSNPNRRAQERQFGYNNDFIAYMPLGEGPSASESGLLCVNHEFTTTKLMFPGLPTQGELGAAMTRAMAEVEMAAHGHSVVEVRRAEGRWTYVVDSPYNRRITAFTPMTLTGPAASHARMRTTSDPSGQEVIGTLFNCAGGKTPWGTVLICEEHIQFYFTGQSASERERDHHRRYGIGGDRGYT
ncbi:MAG: alkaline phosphatase PhoX, partial [Pseudomonadales bacterium]